MSSHHFVKEGQEPALIIADAVPVAVVEPLLEWAPLVVVMENSIDQVSAWGIKTDVVVTQINNTQYMIQKLMDQMPIKILSCAVADEPLDTALYYLISNKQFTVNVIAQNAEKYISKAEKFTDRLEIIIMDEHIRWFSVKSGHFTKWVPANTKLLTLSLQGDVAFSGEAQMTSGKITAEKDGFIIVTSDHLFWVGEYL
jgi:hypothetical protein